MKQIKIAVIAVLLAVATISAKAQSKGPGIDGCFVQTMNWSCWVGIQYTSYQFNLNVDSNFSYAKLYWNGGPYGTVTAKTFLINQSQHGTWKVVAYSTSGCQKDLGKFAL